MCSSAGAWSTISTVLSKLGDMASANDGSAKIYELSDARMRMREGGFSDADLENFETAGAFLKTIREQAGVSLQEIAERTHIRENYLVALEDNNQSAMPSRPFAIGFVKAYAETMGLEPDAIVKRFKRDQGFETALEEQEDQPAQAAIALDQAVGPPVERRDMSLPGVIGVIAFILWCAWQITRPGDVSTPFRLDGLPTNEVAERVSEEPAPGLPPAEEPVFVEARLIERIEPVYPRSCEAGAAAVETVEIGYTVTAEGGVAGERIISSTNTCFDRASRNAVRRWRFDPRTVDGAPRPAYEQKTSLRFVKPQ